MKFYFIPHYQEYVALHIFPFYSDYERRVDLYIRKFASAGDENIFDTEKDSTYQYELQKIDLNKTALLVIDAWEYHGNDGWLQRAKENQATKLAPLLALARKHNITVIHAPHNQKIAAVAEPVEGELVLSFSNGLEKRENFDMYLKKYGITTLLYAGYATNWCVTGARPVAMVHMNSIGYDTILVRDATIAFETPESLSEQWAYKMALNIVETQLGGTITVDDLRTALESNSNPIIE